MCVVARYKATRGVLITLGDPRGAAMPDTEDELGAEAAGCGRPAGGGGGGARGLLRLFLL